MNDWLKLLQGPKGKATNATLVLGLLGFILLKQFDFEKRITVLEITTRRVAAVTVPEVLSTNQLARLTR